MCLGCQGENVLPIPEKEINMSSIQIAVKDAKNPDVIIPGLQVRIEGEAVEASDLYQEGKVMTKGTLALINQEAMISCKSPDLNNRTFTVWAIAPGYVSNFKHISVTTLDSLQYVDLALVKVTDSPAEVNFENSMLWYSNVSSTIPGGLQSVYTNRGNKTFLLAAAVQSTNLSSPVSVELSLGADTHNPETGLPIQAGDPIELWFLPENTSSWERLQDKTILTDAKGRKQVAATLEKAGTLLAGYGLDPCLQPLLITLEKPSTQDQILCVRLLQGNKQVLAERRIAAKSRGPYTLYLPKNLDYTLCMHAGSSTRTNQVYQNDLPNCASWALIKNTN